MGFKPRHQDSRTTLSDDRLSKLRRICMGLMDATEKIAWGDPTWRVKGKIFAMQKGNYAGGRPSVWFKAESGAQPMLIDAAPSVFFVPPYVGHKGWVGAYLDTDTVDWDELEHLISLSYGLIRR